MAATGSSALTKRSASNALMAPPPAPKRIKRPSVVLDEDTYTSAVSHIIRRDFFPGLAEADAQREYLNAVESRDKSWIREAGKKLTAVMTPVAGGKKGVAARTRFDRGSAGDRTPSVWGADTPRSVAATEADEDREEGLGKMDAVDLSMSLGAFQAKYTSEDQESFSQIIDSQNRKRFEKNAWLREGNMYASKQRLAQQKFLALTPPSSSSSDGSKEVAVRPSQNLDDRPAAPTTHKHTPFNTLMFPAESVESWTTTRAQQGQNASLAPPKQVAYNNTRLPTTNPDPDPPRPSSPTLSSIRAAVSGNPRLNPSEGGYTGSETPRVNGYAFVDAQPPDADDDEDDDAPEDLLERYGVTKSNAASFSMAETSRREKMLHRMVDRINSNRSTSVARSNNNNNNTTQKPPPTHLGIFPSSSQTPRFLSAPTPASRLPASHTPRRGTQHLTPAAQRLLERVGGATPRHGAVTGFGAGQTKGMGGEEWTPRSSSKKKKKQ